MLAITLGKRARALALVSVATLVALGGTLAVAVAGAQATTVRTCQGGGAGYTVTVSTSTGSTAGADPYEGYAANCTIGYHEKQGYPFSLIGLVLVVIAATLILLYAKKDILDLPGGGVSGSAFGVTGGDA